MRQDGRPHQLRTRSLVFGFLSIIAMIGFGEVLMSQAGTAAGVKNVVLVHGGFVDGSGWEGVYKALKKDGYTVAIVQNPTNSLAEDVAVTKRTIAAQNGPVILVGHSVRWSRDHGSGERPERGRAGLRRRVRSGQGASRCRR